MFIKNFENFRVMEGNNGENGGGGGNNNNQNQNQNNNQEKTAQQKQKSADELMKFANNNGSGNQNGGDNNNNSDSGNQGGGDSGNQNQNNGNEGDGSGNDLTKLPDWAQKQIKDLRAENAKSRTSGNNLATRLENIENGLKGMFGDNKDKLTPEQQIEQLSTANADMSFQNAVMNFAYSAGVPTDKFDYFSYLVEQKTNSLEEGQELSEEDLKALVTQARAVSGSNSNNSSVDDENQDGKKPGQTGAVTLEQFTNMTMMEKNTLYQKTPELYQKLFDEAKRKKLL